MPYPRRTNEGKFFFQKKQTIPHPGNPFFFEKIQLNYSGIFGITLHLERKVTEEILEENHPYSNKSFQKK